MITTGYVENLEQALGYFHGYVAPFDTQWCLAPPDYKGKAVTEENLEQLATAWMPSIFKEPYQYLFWTVNLYVSKTFAVRGIFEPEIFDCHQQAVTDCILKMTPSYLHQLRPSLLPAQYRIARLDFAYKGQYPWRHSVILILNGCEMANGQVRPLDYDHFFESVDEISKLYHQCFRQQLEALGYPTRGTVYQEFEHGDDRYLGAEQTLYNMCKLDPDKPLTEEEEEFHAFFINN